MLAVQQLANLRGTGDLLAVVSDGEQVEGCAAGIDVTGEEVGDVSGAT